MNKKIKEISYQISAILILFSAVLYMFYPILSAYIMVIGVAGFSAITLTSPYPGKSIRGKRLFNIQVFAVLLMIAGTYLMFIGMSQWVLLFLLAALLTLYCSIVLQRIYDKENRNK